MSSSPPPSAGGARLCSPRRSGWSVSSADRRARYVTGPPGSRSLGAIEAASTPIGAAGHVSVARPCRSCASCPGVTGSPTPERLASPLEPTSRLGAGDAGRGLPEPARLPGRRSVPRAAGTAGGRSVNGRSVCIRALLGALLLVASSNSNPNPAGANDDPGLPNLLLDHLRSRHEQAVGLCVEMHQ